MDTLTILGSGTALSTAYSSGYLLETGGHKYLIDCSEGIKHRLTKININYYDIDGVFVSHFHPDHFNVETLIQSVMVRNFKTKSSKTLQIYGPPEIKKRLKNIWDAKHNDGHFDTVLPGLIDLKIVEFEDGQSIVLPHEGDKKFTLTPYFVAHGNMPASSLRFEIGDFVFTYSGDSGVNDRILESCRGSDLFLCECNQTGSEKIEGHLNPGQAGELARKGNVKSLVLTHMPQVVPPIELDGKVKQTGYKGTVRQAGDFDVLQLVND